MKKNRKVFEIKAHAANDNLRTVYAVMGLNDKLSDACEKDDIPMMSVISAKESAPMTEADAMLCSIMKTLVLRCNPGITYAKTTVKVVS